MSGDNLIFDFERDFAGSLRCIPMVVRLKLDLAGVKLSLRQWSRFTLADREALVGAPRETPAQAQAYHDLLARLITERADEPLVDLPPPAAPEWDQLAAPPARVTAQAAALGLSAVDWTPWPSLSRLQRFSLCKLSRPDHDNDNFVPALVEFGLVGG